MHFFSIRKEGEKVPGKKHFLSDTKNSEKLLEFPLNLPEGHLISPTAWAYPFHFQKKSILDLPGRWGNMNLFSHWQNRVPIEEYLPNHK